MIKKIYRLHGLICDILFRHFYRIEVTIKTYYISLITNYLSKLRKKTYKRHGISGYFFTSLLKFLHFVYLNMQIVGYDENGYANADGTNKSLDETSQIS